LRQYLDTIQDDSLIESFFIRHFPRSLNSSTKDLSRGVAGQRILEIFVHEKSID
jgi:hypothetical protein